VAGGGRGEAAELDVRRLSGTNPLRFFFELSRRPYFTVSAPFAGAKTVKKKRWGTGVTRCAVLGSRPSGGMIGSS
jgi:hypothetical protein